jgi:hypothetical protein
VGHKEQGGGVHRDGDDMLFEQQHLLSTKFQVLSKKKAINFFLKSRISSFHIVEFHNGGEYNQNLLPTSPKQPTR